MDIRERLEAARLYLVCESHPGDHELEPFLRAALRGGVDIIQLRDRSLNEQELLQAAEIFRAAADEFDALFIINDRPDLVRACNADGVHLGQDDQSPASARRKIGQSKIIGRSTHAPEQAAVADENSDVDYLSIGPIYETPTKPGRPATGLEYVTYATENVTKPWFAIGGVDLVTMSGVIENGAERIVIVRALTHSADPEMTARTLRAQLAVPIAG